jgi:DNA-directed RNA polymerase specialized sigma24 family protein
MAMTWEDLQDEKTFDLIDYIKYKEQPDYKDLAEAAFVAFTFRFRKEMIDKCRKIGKKWGYDSGIADTIAERTFERFWKYPYSFGASNCGKLAADDCVRFYLFRIARNCFVDYGKESSGEQVSPYDGTEDIIVEFPGMEHLNIPEEKLNDLQKIHDLIDNALKTLSPKHKIIYLTYKAYEKEGYKLPRTLLKKLREELELTQNSIRVYKNEAFQTIDQYLKLYGTE